MIIFRSLLALSLIVGSASAVAQTSAPSPAPATSAAATPAAVTLPAATCAKPARYPGAKASDTRKAAWHNDVKAWGECIKAYVADLRAQIDARIKLANSTIEDYNAALKELQADQADAESGGSTANTKPK
ncbi:MAG TPA: hypothetical protein PLW68_11170 [Casimicrobiaceae bacterium]|nr:hypothetical protein [Casimicrobiaceae bacterium]